MPSDLQKNLRLLCSRHDSVAEICRLMDMNRLQFNRYLNGRVRPGPKVVGKLCDFFGIDETQLFMPHQQFRELVRQRRGTVTASIARPSYNGQPSV